MPQRTIGDRDVGAIGLGTAAMSLDDVRDDAQSIRTIRAAIDAGVTLIDTAFAYSTLDEPGHAERLVREAVATHPERERVLIGTKGGHWRRSPADFPIDARPATLRVHLERSLRALGVEAIGLYQLHHPDPSVPIEESVGALAEFQSEGLVRLIGVSNVTEEQADRALSTASVVSVQNELSPFRTSDLRLANRLADRGVAYLSHSPFGGWLRAGSLEEAFPTASRLARAREVSVQQLLLAWQLSLAPNIIPIVGARRSESIRASAAAASIELEPTERAALAVEFTLNGDRS
jgi:aryl-alcohol dehydrogenase-like predicted oxidoreductase